MIYLKKQPQSRQKKEKKENLQESIEVETLTDIWEVYPMGSCAACLKKKVQVNDEAVVKLKTQA